MSISKWRPEHLFADRNTQQVRKQKKGFKQMISSLVDIFYMLYNPKERLIKQPWLILSIITITAHYVLAGHILEKILKSGTMKKANNFHFGGVKRDKKYVLS